MLKRATRRWHLLLLLAAGLPLAGDAAAQETPPSFAVSAFALGPTGGSIEADAFAAALNADGWCRASVAPAAKRWNQKPASAPAAEWISVVLVGFGERAEAFAFMFDHPDGAVRLVGHVSYGMTWTPAGVNVWIPPLGRLAAAVRDGYRNNAKAGPRSPVAMRVAEWGSRTVKANAGADDMGEPKAVATVSAGEALPPLEAMLCAALCESGMAPANGAPTTLTLEIRLGFRVSALRLTRQASREPETLVKEDVPEDAYDRYVTRLVRKLFTPDGRAMADFTLLANGPLQVLGATTDRVYVATSAGLAAYDAHSGRKLWPATAKEAPPSYVARTARGESAQIFRWSGGLAGIDLATGSETPGCPVAPSKPWSFAVSEHGDILVANGTALHAYREGKPAWKRDEVSAITAGPAVDQGLVFAGEADGIFRCRNLDNGSEVWRKDFEGEWRGAVVPGDGSVVAFLKGEDALVALKTDDGSLRWRVPVGDVLVKAPCPAGKALLAAGKNNRILLLNPTDGKILGDVRWPTWLLDVAVTGEAKPRIACTDLSGTLTFLDAATLQPLRAMALPARASGAMVYCERFPIRWAAAANAEEGMESLYSSETGPAILVGDAEGFLNVVSLE